VRILIISPLFPPVAIAEAFCSAKFAQALVDANLEPVVVLCTNVSPWAGLDASTLWHPLRDLSIDMPIQRNRLGTLKGLLPFRYQTPHWSYWTHTVVRKAKELHQKIPFDLVISRSFPGHSHVAGYWVSSTLNVPWVAITNDPWDFTPFIAEKKIKEQMRPSFWERLWWRRIATSADVLAFPCERLRDNCMGRRSGTDRTIIIPHIGKSAAPSNPKREFLLVHAGRLDVGDITGRSAKALLAGMKHLFARYPEARPITRLLFVGPESPPTRAEAARFGMTENVDETGVVSYEDSLKHIARATICVLVEGYFREGVFLPSKLCDYLVARKPVLAFSPDVGTVNDLARGRGIIRVGRMDERACGEALCTLFRSFRSGEISAYAPPEAVARRYDASVVAGNFVASLGDLLRPGFVSKRPPFYAPPLLGESHRQL
jgi:glycosyltransferase involved in cell wall biosynthesis